MPFVRPRVVPAATTDVIRAINISGAEFTNASNPVDASSTVWGNTITGVDGSDYHYDSRSGYTTYTDIDSMTWLYQQGYRVLKYCLAWERMQPVLGAALNSTHVNLFNQVLTRAQSVGMKIILDAAHANYGVYYMDGAQTAAAGDTAGTCYRRAVGGDDGAGNVDVPISAFADYWTRLTDTFGGHPNLFGVALMNEPQGSHGNLTLANWQSASQQAVTAIRSRESANGWGSGRLRVFVGGFVWSDCYLWATKNGATGWITDPGGNFRYEAHHYWSEGDDGNYTTYQASLNYATSLGFTAGANTDANHTRVLNAVDGFKSWLDTNNAKGCIGEYGWPKNADVTGAAGDATKWAALGNVFLTRLDTHRLDAIAWSCGEFYSQNTSDLLPIYLRNATGSCPPNRLGLKQGQAATVEAHPAFTY